MDNNIIHIVFGHIVQKQYVMFFKFNSLTSPPLGLSNVPFGLSGWRMHGEQKNKTRESELHKRLAQSVDVHLKRHKVRS